MMDAPCQDRLTSALERSLADCAACLQWASNNKLPKGERTSLMLDSGRATERKVTIGDVLDYADAILLLCQQEKG